MTPRKNNRKTFSSFKNFPSTVLSGRASEKNFDLMKAQFHRKVKRLFHCFNFSCGNESEIGGWLAECRLNRAVFEEDYAELFRLMQIELVDSIKIISAKLEILLASHWLSLLRFASVSQFVCLYKSYSDFVEFD